MQRQRNKISIHGSSFQKELFKHVDPANVPECLGGEWVPAEGQPDWYRADIGPWNDYPGDEFGEAAKQALLEEEKNEIAASEGVGIPPVTPAKVQEVTEEMAKLQVDPAAPTPSSIPPPDNS